MRYSRIDLATLNTLLSWSPLRKINKDRLSKKILKRIKHLNLSSEIDVNKITSDYIDHLNSDLFSPLGRRLHSILSYSSLCEGSRFFKKLHYLDKEIQPPVIVVGLPRSGTTNLHNLIINNFNYSGLKYWELSSPSKVSKNLFIDKKIRRFKSSFGFYIYRYLIPSIQSMHRVNMDTYEECWHFQRHLFLCYNYVIQLKFLQLEDFLLKIDTTQLLMHYKSFILQANKKNPIALKCPDHMMFIPDIINAFPEAKIIWIHRDPLDAITSYSPMIENVWNLFFGNTKKKRVGDFITRLYARMLKKIMDDRKRVNTEVIDVSFRQLINDRGSLIKSLSNKLENPIKENSEVGKASKFFKNRYSLNPSSYNISKEEIEKRFSFYTKEYSKYL